MKGELMRYLIDHVRKSVHRTTFANDSCHFHTTPAEKREFSEDQTYIKRLIEEEKFEECPFCKIISVKPNIKDM
jgi:hypothetical protein